MKYAVKTLGCKVNQVESVYLAESLERLGLEKAGDGEKAAVCIINTCTVTAKTDAQCRQMIRRIVRENPGAYVMVTGCYAELEGGAVGEISGVQRVFGNQDKRRAMEILEKDLRENNLMMSPKTVYAPPEIKGSDTPMIYGSDGRSRAFVRVQDGCEAFCAYCIVPYARGPIRSENPECVVRQVQELVKQGFPEIVLSGIHLGAYGLDRNEKNGLARLLGRLVRIQGEFRIRLSSLEPGEVSDELINLVTGEEKICNHLHIPLQSGDNQILKSMKRPYTTGYYAELVFGLRDQDPEMAIGTDLIVGLPGETEASFEKSREWISSLPLTHFHIFPYSIRPGTEAASMRGQVNSLVKKQRAALLRDLSRELKMQFVRHIGGKRLRAVHVSKEGSSDQTRKVLTDNYLEGEVAGLSNATSGIFFIKISGGSDDKLSMRVVE